jgi:hypothetical protein
MGEHLMRKLIAGVLSAYGFAVLADRIYPPYPERRRRGIPD